MTLASGEPLSAVPNLQAVDAIGCVEPDLAFGELSVVRWNWSRIADVAGTDFDESLVLGPEEHARSFVVGVDGDLTFSEVRGKRTSVLLVGSFVLDCEGHVLSIVREELGTEVLLIAELFLLNRS